MKTPAFPTIKIAPLIILALKDLLKPKIILAICLPIVFAVLAWVFVTYLLWDDLQTWSLHFIQFEWVKSILNIFPTTLDYAGGFFTFLFRVLFVVLFIFPMTIVTATILTSLFLVPVLVNELRQTDFPTLIKKSSSIFSGWGTTLGYSAKYLFAWFGSLPFWFIPFAALIIPYLLLSWFNSRVFTYEVLIEVAAPEEIKMFVTAHSRSLFGLGLATSFLYSIPFVNFFAPLITSALFSRYCITQFHSDLNYQPSYSVKGPHV